MQDHTTQDCPQLLRSLVASAAGLLIVGSMAACGQGQDGGQENTTAAPPEAASSREAPERPSATPPSAEKKRVSPKELRQQ